MFRSMSTIAAATAFALIAGSANAQYYPPSPAHDFDASSYQSRGGIGRAGSSASPSAAPRVYGYTRYDANPHAVPYAHSCGNHRYWNGDRCVNSRKK